MTLSWPVAPAVVPRQVPEGTVPLISVEGTAYDCGRAYAETVRERYPGYRRSLDGAGWWASAASELVKLDFGPERRPDFAADHSPIDCYRSSMDRV
jgi:hypothetical protein